MTHKETNMKGRLWWPALVVFAACSTPGLGQGPGVATTTPAVVKHVDPADQRIWFYQAQLKRDPDYWVNYNRLAAAYAQKARETGDISYFELAETALNQSLKLESTHTDAAPAYTQLATVHLAEHKFSEAGEDAAKAIALEPGEMAAYPYAGDAQLEMGNYDASQKYYEQLTEPRDGRPHQGIAFLAASHGAGLDWIKGDTAKATADLEKAVQLARDLHLPAENLAWTQFMLGEQFFQMGDLAAAEREETASLSAFPRYHRALAAMGQIRAAQEKYPEAISFYKDAVSIIPLPVYIAALGDVYAVSGDKAQAEKEYSLVEYIGKLSAINKQVFNRELALFYADHDRKLADGLALARKELEVRHDVYTSDALAWALLKNGQAAKAKDEIEKALRMGTQDALMEYHAGLIYGALGDKAKEEAHLKRALAINPGFHVIFAGRAAKMLAGLEGDGTGATVAAAGAADAH